MARLPLDFFPEARVDALEAYDWYAERSPEAADAFQDELEDTRRAIQVTPERWAKYLLGTRRYLMKHFPFAIVYRETPDRIEIVAVAHGGRKPGYWRVVCDTIDRQHRPAAECRRRGSGIAALWRQRLADVSL